MSSILYCFAGPMGSDPHAVQIAVSDEDKARFEALPPQENDDEITVVDEDSGVAWIVRRAACNADCYCAAEAQSVALAGGQTLAFSYGHTPRAVLEATCNRYPIRAALGSFSRLLQAEMPGARDADCDPRAEVGSPDFLVAVIEALGEAAAIRQDESMAEADTDRAETYASARVALLALLGVVED